MNFVFFREILHGYLANMDVFSLEEDDGNDMFITLTLRDDQNRNFSSILGDPMDFSSPCVSLVNRETPHYLDISDDEFCLFPSFQVNADITANYNR